VSVLYLKYLLTLLFSIFNYLYVWTEYVRITSYIKEMNKFLTFGIKKLNKITC